MTEGQGTASALVRLDSLPLQVEVVAEPDPGTLLRWNGENLEVLHAVAACDDVPRDLRDEHGALALELARLDAKLRLVLRLLGRLTEGRMPPRVSVRLGASRLEWTGRAPASPGQYLVGSLYLSPLVPQPLLLPGRLVATSGAVAADLRNALQYEGLSPPVIEALERHIFQHHRRSIAHARPVPADR
jgi:hypothetical protein